MTAPGRLPRCRQLVREAPTNRARMVTGPRLLSQCTGEVAVDERPYLCPRHLSEAMALLVEAGAVVVLAELPAEIRELIEKWQLDSAQEVTR